MFLLSGLVPDLQRLHQTISSTKKCRGRLGAKASRNRKDPHHSSMSGRISGFRIRTQLSDIGFQQVLVSVFSSELASPSS
jgi:hypothetical protein